MRWHSEHGMEHMWAPKDSPAAGGTRYGHGLSRTCTREKIGRRTTLWRYISGKIVELMSKKFWESSSRDGDVITSRFSPKVRLGWLAPPALRLALRYICMKSHSLCQEHSLPTWRQPRLRVELRGPAAKVSWVIFCLGRLLSCLEILRVSTVSAPLNHCKDNASENVSRTPIIGLL